MGRMCCRCGIMYYLSKDGDYLAQDTTCIYHYGKAWKKKSIYLNKIKSLK